MQQWQRQSLILLKGYFVLAGDEKGLNVTLQAIMDNNVCRKVRLDSPWNVFKSLFQHILPQGVKAEEMMIGDVVPIAPMFGFLWEEFCEWGRNFCHGTDPIQGESPIFLQMCEPNHHAHCKVEPTKDECLGTLVIVSDSFLSIGKNRQKEGPRASRGSSEHIQTFFQAALKGQYKYVEVYIVNGGKAEDLLAELKRVMSKYRQTTPESVKFTLLICWSLNEAITLANNYLSVCSLKKEMPRTEQDLMAQLCSYVDRIPNAFGILAGGEKTWGYKYFDKTRAVVNALPRDSRTIARDFRPVMKLLQRDGKGGGGLHFRANQEPILTYLVASFVRFANIGHSSHSLILPRNHSGNASKSSTDDSARSNVRDFTIWSGTVIDLCSLDTV